MNMIITPEELAHRLKYGEKTTLIASFWRPGDDNGRHLFQSEHIPSSLFCDTALALAGLPSRTSGRNPLPSVHQLSQWFVKWGINTDHQVVVYDEGDGLFASRAWWVLTWAGVEGVCILNGGMQAWREAGYELPGGPGNLPAFSNLRPNIGQLPVVDIDDVKRASETGDRLLIDCRSRWRFSGQKEFLDLKAGHIPGSVNVPVRDMIDRSNGQKLRSPEEIRELFSRAGIDSAENAIIISGSGVHSAQAIFAMHYAGLPGAALYPGGWSQWCADRSNPVERGLVPHVA